MRKTRSALLLFVMLVGVVAAACGGGGGEDPEKTPGERITDPARVPSSTPIASLISCDDAAPAAGTCYKIAGRQVEVGTVAGTFAAPDATSAATGTAKRYVVQSGDLCGTIAEAHGVSVDELLKANRTIDANCSNLQAGAELVIPGTQAANGAATPTPRAGQVQAATASPTPTPASTGGKVHVVQSGESCEGIAGQYGVTTAALIAANPSVNASCSNLQLEQELTIP